MSKDVVLATYPKAECREITSPSGPYFMIYDMGSIVQNLIGFDMESEEKAWELAATQIQTNMVRTLEK